MKKIVMCVTDDIVGTILGLVGDYVTELSVTTVEDTKAPMKAPRAAKGTKRLPVEETRTGRLVMSGLPQDGTKVLRAFLEERLEAAGFKRSSLTPLISQLSARGLVIKLGDDHIARRVQESANTSKGETES